MPTFLSALLLGIASILSAVTAQAAPACQGCVRIGSWNIQDFGSERRRQTASAEQLAAMIADAWQLDLIALQEINSSASEYRGVRYSDKPWQELASALRRRGYQVAVGDSGYQQRLAFAWRPPVTLRGRVRELATADRYQPSENCRAGGLRKPLSGYFQAGNFDFHAVNVHLKSSFGNARCGHEVRLLQSKELLRLTATLEQKDPELLVLGDFNASAAHASLQPLAQRWHGLLSKPQRAAGSGASSQGEPARGNVIDLLWSNAAAARTWRANSSMIFQPANDAVFYRQFSDHRPVWADFTTR